VYKKEEENNGNKETLGNNSLPFGLTLFTLE
jgi:hypothetical protein